jgi:hypothetical protein
VDTAERNSLLRTFFLFSDADLQANEQGFVSSGQQMGLNQHVGGARQVAFVVIPRNYVTSYYATIGGTKFDVWTDDDNFVDGTPYRVHYINKFGVRTVLSAVALDA